MVYRESILLDDYDTEESLELGDLWGSEKCSGGRVRVLLDSGRQESIQP